MNQAAIGSYIAKKRREKNLTQEQLAETLGVSNKTISKWENGKCSRITASSSSSAKSFPLHFPN